MATANSPRTFWNIPARRYIAWITSRYQKYPERQEKSRGGVIFVTWFAGNKKCGHGFWYLEKNVPTPWNLHTSVLSTAVERYLNGF